jgi:hypothetical protein
MKTLNEIRRQLAAGQFEFSRHAFKRAVERNINEAGKSGIIIEDYPDDKYTPSCLLLGFTAARRPLHLQVSYANADLVKLITLYEPERDEWLNYKTRR